MHNITSVRFVEFLHIGKSVSTENNLHPGKNCGGERIVTLSVHDTIFMCVELTSNGGQTTYKQFIPWAQVGTCFFDDAPTAKS